MTDEITEDKNLLRCTLKKSYQVFTKLLWCALYAVIVSAILIGISYCGYYGLPVAISIITTVIGTVWGIIVLVPWWVHVGVVIIAAILIYSFLWCIARELTDEDWNSEDAKFFAFISLLLTLVLLVLSLLTLASSPLSSITHLCYS